LCGPLYEHFGVNGFFAMVPVALLSLVLLVITRRVVRR
jgi:PPP family 3-phenylpropionic acid transporter